MPTPLRELEELHSSCNPCCIVESCRRRRCKIVLDTIGNVICLDCDKCGVFTENNRRPDFIILYYDSVRKVGRWLVIEMKGRVSHPRHIVEQLQEGAEVIALNSKFKVSDSPKVLNAIVVRDKHVRTSDFAQRHITFLGRRLWISVIRPGSSLSSLVN